MPGSAASVNRRFGHVRTRNTLPATSASNMQDRHHAVGTKYPHCVVTPYFTRRIKTPVESPCLTDKQTKTC